MNEYKCFGFIMFYTCFRPIINGKFEEKTAGDGPSLPSMFEDDKHLQGVINFTILDLFYHVFRLIINGKFEEDCWRWP